MTKNKNGVQGLIGLERFTRFGVKTDKAELAFFSVEPTNISVLSAANIDVKIHHLMMLLSTIPDLEILALDSCECFDRIAPGIIRFYTDHYICGNSFRCIWAVTEYPPSTEETAILAHLAVKS